LNGTQPAATLRGRLEKVKSSNPVLSRLGRAAEQQRAGYGAYGPAGQPGYGQPYPTAAGYPAAPPAVPKEIAKIFKQNEIYITRKTTRNTTII